MGSLSTWTEGSSRHGLLLGGMIQVLRSFHAVFETEIVSTLAEGCWNPSGGCIARILVRAVHHR